MELIDHEEKLVKKKKSKTLITIIVVTLVLLILSAVGLIIYRSQLDKELLKVHLDGVLQTQTSSVFRFENGKVYISVRDFVTLTEKNVNPAYRYTSYNGRYRQYSEDITKGYIQNQYEIVSFESGSNKIYKYQVNNDKEMQYYTLSEQIRFIDNKLYVSEDGIRRMFNVQFTYSAESNTITIFSLPYLANFYSNTITDSAVVGNSSTDTVAFDVFTNQKALLDNFIVVKSEAGLYGVRDLNKNERIGMKYRNIKYIESTQEFIVTTQEGTVGILDSNAIQKIAPEYDSVNFIDKDLGLFLVEKNKRQGVVNSNGKFIVYMDYDKVGIDVGKFSKNNITNGYLLLNNCIPVQKSNKWGLFDKNGTLILPIEYDFLGCEVGTTTGTNSSSVLTIPDIGGIVIGKKIKVENQLTKEQIVYGIVDSTAKELVPTSLQQVYATTNAGVTTYYMTYDNQEIDIVDYLKQISEYNKQQSQNQNQTNQNQVNQNTTMQNNQNQVSNTVQNNDQGQSQDQNDGQQSNSQEQGQGDTTPNNQ